MTQPLSALDLAALERGLAGTVRCNECGATDGLTPSGGACGEEAVHRNCPRLRGGPWAPDALADRTYALPSREQAVALVAELRASQEREAAAFRAGCESMRAEAGMVECGACDRGTVTITTGDGSFGTLEPQSCDRCEGTGRVPPAVEIAGLRERCGVLYGQREEAWREGRVAGVEAAARACDERVKHLERLAEGAKGRENYRAAVVAEERANEAAQLARDVRALPVDG